MALIPCPYCTLPISAGVEREHVFPRRWYPDGVEVQRLTVPSCSKCNRAFKLVEERLMRLWGLCLSETHPASKGIGDRMLRSVDRRYARDLKDSTSRQRAMLAVNARMRVILPGTTDALPGIEPAGMEWFHTPAGIALRGTLGLDVEIADLNALAEKLVRGLHYFEHGEPLPIGYRIYTLDDKCQRFQMIPGPSAPPAFCSMKVPIPEDFRSGLWSFDLWQQIQLLVAVRAPA